MRSLKVKDFVINDGTFRAFVVGADGVHRFEKPRIPAAGDTNPVFDFDDGEQVLYVNRTYALQPGDLEPIPYVQTGKEPA